ncbi:MAG TPA: dienelactone hydrolase family protein [Thermoanaerobaculia bacterium]|nr:dienelactone hydrolase family protein [Thermoanaerobaculia bacterium]
MRWRRASFAILVILLSTGLVLFVSCSGLRCIASSHSTHDDEKPTAIKEWAKDEPAIDGMTVYVKGEGPPVILLHEVPGLLPETVRFAEKLAGAGYRVYMPLFFGKFNDRVGRVRQFFVCAGPNFNCLSTDESPVVKKLETLRDRITANGRQRVAIIGMCLTGGMPLALVNDRVAAVVLSQPAVPFPLSAAKRASLGVDLDRLEHKAWQGHVLAIRFAEDCLATKERFETLCRKIPTDHLTIHVVPTDKPCAHSVLTVEGQNKANGDVKTVAQTAIQHTTCFLARHLKKKEECRDESDRPCHAD